MEIWRIICALLHYHLAKTRKGHHAMGIFNPSIFLKLNQRSVSYSRNNDGETRELWFNASMRDEDKLFVIDKEYGRQEVKTGAVSVHAGRYERKGRDVLGLISYVGPFSCSDQSYEELIEEKDAHIKEHGTREPFPFEHLICPASFKVMVWVNEETFEALARADFATCDFLLNLTLNPDNESSVLTEHGLFGALNIVWVEEKEPCILAEKVVLTTRTKMSLPLPQPNEAEPSFTTYELAVLNRLEGLEKRVLWCFGVLIVTAVILYLKRC